jgi:hypothetical protein
MLGLRDAHFLDWKDSLLGVIEASMHDGPVYFDCYPNFTVSLSDPHIFSFDCDVCVNFFFVFLYFFV